MTYPPILPGENLWITRRGTKVGAIILFTLLVTASIPALGKLSMLSSADRRILDRAYHGIRSVGGLPASIAALCSDENGRFANPNEKWEPTDFIKDATLPRKRLIWAVNSGMYYVVHYESGGRAHAYHVLFASVNESREFRRPRIHWRWFGERFPDFKAFVSALDRGELSDDIAPSDASKKK